MVYIHKKKECREGTKRRKLVGVQKGERDLSL